MIRFAVTLPVLYVFFAFSTMTPATATTIDFDVQAGNRGGNLTGIPDSPLMIGIATLTGGELLSGEVGLNADTTGIYASEGLFGSGETNPLVITFTMPVQNFSVFVLNGDDTRSYTVSDNLGNSITKSLASAGALGGAEFALPGSGLSTVEISSANADAWDFAVDNLTFTDITNSTPEPEASLLLSAGLGLLTAIRGRTSLTALLTFLRRRLVQSSRSFEN
jgi:hypothetical protein